MEKILLLHKATKLSLDRAMYGDVAIMARVAGRMKKEYHEKKNSISNDSND